MGLLIVVTDDDIESFLRFWFKIDSEPSSAKKNLLSRGLKTILQRFEPHHSEHFGDLLLAVYQLMA